MSIIGIYNVTIGNAWFQPVDPVAIGLSRVPIQFKDKANFLGFLTCLLTPLVQLEQSIARTVAQRNVNISTGQSLTNLGKLVGISRDTTVDDDFRRYVRAQLAVNHSRATFADIITVAKLVLDPSFSGSIVLHNEGTATARLTIVGAIPDTVGSILATLEQAAVATGVRLVVQYSPTPTANLFTYDVGPGFDLGHLATDIG